MIHFSHARLTTQAVPRQDRQLCPGESPGARDSVCLEAEPLSPPRAPCLQLLKSLLGAIN